MTTATDPVCGMVIQPSAAAGSITHDATIYHFCSRSCQERFQANPGKYAGTARNDRDGRE